MHANIAGKADIKYLCHKREIRSTQQHRRETKGCTDISSVKCYEGEEGLLGRGTSMCHSPGVGQST